MIVAISDLHLGYERCNKADILQFLDACKGSAIDHLVLIGDVMDLWQRNAARLVVENSEILAKIARLDAEVHYVAGNHDYAILSLAQRYGDRYPFAVSQSLRLEDGGKRFYFVHGYELAVITNLAPLKVEAYEEWADRLCWNDQVVSWFASQVWGRIENTTSLYAKAEMIQEPPHKRRNIRTLYDVAVSPGAYVLLGMHPDERLVFGHTHRPFINAARTVANTGSWVDELVRERAQNWYLRIEDGTMALKRFDASAFP